MRRTATIPQIPLTQSCHGYKFLNWRGNMLYRAIIHRLMEGFTSCPHHTDAIGQDLGIVPIPDNSDHPVPQFTAALEQGTKGSRVRIDYTKYGHQGIAIESRSNGGPRESLAIVTQKPTYDYRPLAAPGTPENRNYRMRWWDKDEANGERSAVQTVLVGGGVKLCCFGLSRW